MMSLETALMIALHIWLVPALFLSGAEWWAMRNGRSDYSDVAIAFFWPISIPGIMAWNRIA